MLGGSFDLLVWSKLPVFILVVLSKCLVKIAVSEMQ